MELAIVESNNVRTKISDKFIDRYSDSNRLLNVVNGFGKFSGVDSDIISQSLTHSISFTILSGHRYV